VIRRSFVKQVPDLVPEGADAPALGPAHLGVEFPLQPVFDGDQFHEMAPTQLSRQRRDNLFFGEHICELHHPPQPFVREPVACFVLLLRLPISNSWFLAWAGVTPVF
jgi:hypothetical protein